MKKYSIVIWLIITLGIASYYGYTLLKADDKSDLLIGDTTHGHFQIELACSSCHTEAFGGGEVLQEACVSCHQDELDAAHDSHPKKKFNDPRNADRLEVVDARYCISCHTEHQSEQTSAMGLTLPEDYCYHCHQEIADERESHQDLPFDSCATAGCHNYHDNRALYENFLIKHAGGTWLKELPEVLKANHASNTATNTNSYSELAHAETQLHPHIHEELSLGAHAEVSCASCHSNEQNQWIASPGADQCQSCHSKEAETFAEGKHGMRLAQGLDAMRPADSELSFKAEAHSRQLECSSCHQPHNETQGFSAEGACLGCHNDEHSLAFEASPHAKLSGEQDVSCATCHMPNTEIELWGEKHIFVQHNQNDALRPNEKMIRPVCMQCHNLEFSIDALADEALIKNNFNGQPSNHIPSIDWAMEREQSR